ncbi:CAAX prenyl protease-like protein [Cellulophaga sp. RHA19]|uniref:CPBP family intramembrane glutamic endopeptidase n=1 Tax=Cellulophaga sp. RHA19 TaxID=1798237 RepID=UPI000C2C488F|nr:type II CAAX endopeptidase family protein [Cellulophaga sp. RHA19]PKB44939.1 CAAX prenyl protease-like protein [Cellulophaga sp. RHA19]
MKITKAILLTLLVTVVYYIPQVILALLVKYTNWDINLFNPMFDIVLSLSAVMAYLFVFYLFWKPKPHYSHILEINGLNYNLIPYLIISAIGLGFVGQPFWDYNRLIEYFQNSSFEPITRSYGELYFEYGYTMLSTLIIAPIFEELFYRKFLFSKLLEKYQLYLAIFISSLCFSAIHFETPGNLIPSFLFGITSCLIFFKTKKISYSILLHFINNLLVTLINTSYGELFFNWLDGLKYDVFYWTLFVFGILITILGAKKITTANNT